MAKFQVTLNGSNISSEARRRAFQDALEDSHQIDCGPASSSNGSGQKGQSESAVVTGNGSEPIQQKSPPPPVRDQPGGAQETPAKDDLLDAVQNTFQHQQLTIQTHQEFLEHQAEYLQLVSTVLDQQGAALDGNPGGDVAGTTSSFQRSLDSIHKIREQGLAVHQEFLRQQADFSERYLSLIEGSPITGRNGSNGAAIAEKSQILLEEQDPAPIQDSIPEVQEPEDSQIQSPPEAVPPVPAGGPAEITSRMLEESLLEIVGQKTGYPPEMLEMEMDLEADLGIDSIKRVEILGAMEDEYPDLPPADTEVLGQIRTLQEIVSYLESQSPASPSTAAEPPQTEPPAAAETPPAPRQESAPSPSGKDLAGLLLEIVAEKTGYPEETLEPEMDLEADLGIDSIKRVEILGAVEERLPDLPPADTETLAELRTLAQIIEYMDSSRQPSVAGDDKKKEPPHSLKGAEVQLVSLPAPDRLELDVPAHLPLLVSDDGSSLTRAVAESLQALGWQVLIWRYPGEIAPSSGEMLDSLVCFEQPAPGKESIQKLLDRVSAEYGPPAGFIHLHPQKKSEGLFSADETPLIRELFLLAGSLKEPLEASAAETRPMMISVTRIDGRLGMGSRGSFQLGGGLTGLIKTLSWEWPAVYCKAIDIDPELALESQTAALLAEIRDPNLGLQEVGIDALGRWTGARVEGA